MLLILWLHRQQNAMASDFLFRKPGFEKISVALETQGPQPMHVDLEKQAAAYRKLAVQRAKQYKLDLLPQSTQSN
jgi:hypothetical protein